MVRKVDLIKCIECGNQVSIHASSCPQCTTKYICGSHCCICGKIGTYSKGITKGVIGRWMHTECFNEISNEIDNVPPYMCPACNKATTYTSTLHFKNFNEELVSKGLLPRTYIELHAYGECSQCGHPKKFHICEICGITIHPAFARKVTYKEDKVYVHQKCYFHGKSRGIISLFNRLKYSFKISDEPYRP